MATHELHNWFDVILIGGGLATSAAARMIASAGKSVATISGAGRSRSLDADGGLVDPMLVSQAFGAGAPLGATVSWLQCFAAADVRSRSEFAPKEEMPERRSFRRLELERWAIDRAIDAGAVFLDDFIEGQVLSEADHLVLIGESDDRSIRAAKIVLCEGSDPRIAMRAGLRPDYSPEEQIHFARAIIARPSRSVVRTGRTRTSWGMPIGVTVTPMGSVTLVSVDSRIENVMRGAKSTQEALMDVLTSRLGSELGLEGEKLHSGIELGAMRSNEKHLSFSNGCLLLGIDASGMLDMRNVDRADITIRSGLWIGDYLARNAGGNWDDVARTLTDEIKAPDPGWHDSRRTRYIEESSAEKSVKRSFSRLARGVAGRLRKER